MRRVCPPKPVQVERDDVWHIGQLEAWRRDGDGWVAFVRYSASVGMRHLKWVDAKRVRLDVPAAR